MTAAVITLFGIASLVAKPDIIQFRLDAPGNEILYSNEEYAAMMAAKAMVVNVIFTAPTHPPFSSPKPTGIVSRLMLRNTAESHAQSKSARMITVESSIQGQQHLTPPKHHRVRKIFQLRCHHGFEDHSNLASLMQLRTRGNYIAV